MSDLPEHLGGNFQFTLMDEPVLDFFIERFGVQSMLDIGCGPGGMTRYARQRGLRAVGIDGDYTVLPKEPSFMVHDYQLGPAPLDGEFDLVWSVEFLEHVEERYQTHYLTDFARGRIVLCTAAQPGQWGHHHVNLQPVEYWVRVFAERGYRFELELTVAVRSTSRMRSINCQTGATVVADEIWMRTNSMVFVR